MLNNINIIQMLFLIPEVFFITTNFVLFFFNVTSFKKNEKYSTNFINNYINLTIMIIFITIALILINPNKNFILLNSAYLSDNMSIFFKLLTLITFILFLFFFKDTLLTDIVRSIELIFMLVNLTASLLLIIGANDFIWLYLTLELSSISTYGILFIKRVNTSSVESIIKYFIATSIVTIIFLFSISLVYLQTGAINFEDLRLFFWENEISSLMIFGLFLLFISIMFKMGVAPLHIWMLDAYKNLNYAMLFYLLIFPKILLIYLLVIFFNMFYSTILTILPIVGLFIIVTSILGVGFGLFQFKFKNLFIFSSISNISFFLILFLLNGNTGHSTLFYFLILYLINMLGIFMCLNIFKSWSTTLEFKNISDLSNLFKVNPLLAIIFSSFLFSLAGLPPFPGFLWKFNFLSLLIHSGHWFLYFMLMTTYVISAFYYLRITKIMFINKNNKWIFIKPINRKQALLLAIIFISNIFAIVFQDYILLLLSLIC